MPYNSTTGIMTAPINTNTGGDIQQALNTFVNGDIGNTITVAAQNGKVNKWAKYKPVRHSAIGYVTDTQRVNINQGFHCSTSGSYDADSFYQQSKENCFNAANASTADWTYVPPTGTIGTSPFRMFDFTHIESDLSKIATHDGYNTRAISPFSLNTIGIYPNDSTETGKQDFACTFYYHLTDLSLTDLAIYNSLLPTHNWYYCVIAKLPGDGNNITVIPIMTSLHGSTRMAVGTPSSELKIGYFTLTLNQQMVGDASAFLAIYGENKTTGDADANFIFLPVGKDADFEIRNISADLRFAWTSIQDTRQPSPRVQGVRITYETSGSATLLTSAQFRVVIAIPQDYSAASSFTISVTPKIMGVYEGIDVGYATGTGTYLLNPSQLPSNNVTYVDVSLTGFAPIMVDSIAACKISMQIQFGNEPSFYLDPIHSSEGSMVHGATNVEVFETVGDINSLLGSNYVSITS